jgi:hypothetical protein
MKKTITLLFLFYTQFAYSQGLGIGANPPHSSAELDVNSTTRGMLIPRMTASQRAAIVNPAAGLLVFQTDNFLGSPSSLSGLYIYETNNAIVGWKRIAKAEEINNSGSNTWVVSGANQSSGVSGNVGIGTNTPSEKLHVVGYTQVDGNIFLNNSNQGLLFKEDNITKGRVNLQGVNDDLEIGTVTGNTTGKLNLETKFTPRLTILPDGNVGIGTLTPDKKLHVNGDFQAEGVAQATGLISTGTLSVASNTILGGAVAGASTASFSGNINSNTSMSINDPLAELTLKASSVDKGFLQLSGDNLRIGTFSTNNTGKFVVRTNGGDHFTIDQNGNSAFGIDPVGLGAKLAVFGKGRFIENGGDALESQGKLRVKQDGEAIHIDGNDPAINFFETGTQRGYLWAVNNDINLGTSVSTGKMYLNSSQINLQTPQVNVDGKLTATTTGPSYNLLPVCYGRVAANGSKLGGTPNFTVSKPCINGSPGCYYINSPQITASSIIIINVDSWLSSSSSLFATFHYQGNGDMGVYIKDDAGDPINSNFNFVIYDP